MGINFRGRRGTAGLAAAAVAVVGAGAAIGVAATSGGGDPQEDFAAALSDQVGAQVTVDDLQAAREQVAKERLDEAVASGRITQEEADEMLERLKEPPEKREEMHAAREASQAPIAKALGVTTEELHEARHDGKTLLELAEEKGVSRADLEAAVKKGIAAGAAASGRTAPTGEDLEEMVDRIVESEGRGGPGRGHGGPGGPGGLGGPGGGFGGPLGP
jgi:polyhydroxyalkanoate synthesis regulator phasin